MDRITRDQLFERGLFDEVNKGAEELLKNINGIKNSIEDSLKVQREYLANWKATDSKSVNGLASAIKDTDAKMQAAEKLRIQEEKLEKGSRVAKETGDRNRKSQCEGTKGSG
jgi:hypothetical protein